MNTPPLSFEALMVLDAIDRRGSFAAAAEELNRATSSLSYQVQKLEQDLGLILFDRSGHRAVFTQAGALLLSRGRQLLQAADELVADANALAHGWELELTVAVDGLLGCALLYPMVNALSAKTQTQLRFREEILAGSWEALSEGRADLVVKPIMPSQLPPQINHVVIGQVAVQWYAHPEHAIHQMDTPLDDAIRQKFRAIAVADSALKAPKMTRNILDNQECMTVSTMNDKLLAITAGLGIGTLPVHLAQPWVERELLQPISDDIVGQLDVIVGWQRDRMGKAKSWCIQYLKQQFASLMAAP